MEETGEALAGERLGDAAAPRRAGAALIAGLAACVAAAAAGRLAVPELLAVAAVAHVAVALAAGRLLGWEGACAIGWLTAVGAQVPTAFGPSDDAIVATGEGLAITGVAWAALLTAQHLRADAEAARDCDGMPLVDLTSGLSNGEALRLRAAAELARARRHEESFTLLWVEVEGLPGGPSADPGVTAADAALRRIGAAILGVLRGEDLVARVGERELAVLLPEAGPAEAVAVSARVEGAIGRALLASRQLDDTSATVAGASFPADALAVEDLLAAARERARAPEAPESL